MASVRKAASLTARMANTADIKERIRQKALSMGFLGCGFSAATFLEEEAPRLEAWLKAGHHGTMQWMENHFDMRLDPRLLVPGASTVISVVYNY